MFFYNKVPIGYNPSAERVTVRVRSHCRFSNRGTEYVGDSGMKWMSLRAKPQCDRALVTAQPIGFRPGQCAAADGRRGRARGTGARAQRGGGAGRGAGSRGRVCH
jgi:hypothetical protein